MVCDVTVENQATALVERGERLRSPGHGLHQRRYPRPASDAANEKAEEYDHVNAVNLRGVGRPRRTN